MRIDYLFEAEKRERERETRESGGRSRRDTTFT
jgi:hypothetical protein